MRKSNFALRLQPSLLAEARKLAEEEGVALNQLINVAVAEKLSALRTEKYLVERGSPGRREARSCHPGQGRQQQTANARRRTSGLNAGARPASRPAATSPGRVCAPSSSTWAIRS
ncbi:MAG: toxin-antitoxin system HicB family antitoxin [Sphingomonadales bacterium]